MTDCTVHNIRFYDVSPRTINCLSYEPKRRKLALSRADSSLEIWDLTHTPHLERTIPGQKNGSIEAIAWCDKRLFTCGLHGYVCEQDLRNLKELTSLRVTAGSAWCLGINKAKSYIAVGTEDGYINVFAIFEDGLRYEKLLDKQEGRIMSLAWDHTGNTIVTGSIDALRVWNVNTGHAVHKMTTGRSTKKKETIVWCIAITSDFTIITGDSRGKVTFWDGNMGVSMETYQSHKADILCLALSDDQKTLYCSGVDPTIVSFKRVSNGNADYFSNNKQGSRNSNHWQKSDQRTPEVKDRLRSQWSRSHQRRVCDHDVRALAVCGQKLFSGGVDSYLTRSYMPKSVNKYPCLLQTPCAQLCPQARRVLLRYPSHLEMWSLGATSKIYEGNRGTFSNSLNKSFTESLPLKCDPIKLVELHSLRNENMVCGAAASDGTWICYSTSSVTRLYNVIEIQSIPKLDKVPLPLDDDVALNMTFSSDSSQLVLLTRRGRLLNLGLAVSDSPEVTVISDIQPYEKGHLKDAVHLLAISRCKNYIVAADHESNIAVWKQNEYYCSLPRSEIEPTALAIHPETNDVVVTYADQKLVEFSLSKKSFTKFSRNLALPETWRSSPYVATNVTFDPRNPDVIVFHSDVSICVINKTETADDPSTKVRRTEKQRQNLNFNMIKKYKHLVLFDWICDDEVAAVEVSPEIFTSQLPPPLNVKRFGVM